MKVVHEVCIDVNPLSDAVTLTGALLTALGHGPDLKFRADNDDDVIHGRLIEMRICHTRELGVDVLQFADGHREVASAENIGAWLVEHGHKLVRIDGNKALGNTIVHVQVTEADEEPTAGRKTTLRRPAVMPTEQQIRDRIDAFAASLQV